MKIKADELEKARSALMEQTKAQNPYQLRETRSVVDPVEQINIELSCPHPAYRGTTSVGGSFTFVATKELPPSHIRSRQPRSKKNRRQRQTQPQPEPQIQSEQGLELEPKPAPPSQLGMFSHDFYHSVPANRPRRSHIYVEETIISRLYIPLDKIHTIVSKLDKIKNWQDGMADKTGLVISTKLTELSIDDLNIMQNLRMSIPGSSQNPRKVMNPAKLEIPRTLVDLLATDDRLAISAFLDGASFPQARASNDIVRGKKSQGTQTKVSDTEVKGIKENITGQEEVAVVKPMSPGKF